MTELLHIVYCLMLVPKHDRKPGDNNALSWCNFLSGVNVCEISVLTSVVI